MFGILWILGANGMKVSIRTTMGLKQIIGQYDVSLSVEDGATVAGMLELLADRYGDELAEQIFEPQGRIPHASLMIMVNGRNIAFLNRLDTALKDGDELTILPLVGGG
jgi:molybdopterin synthase sulfur carrier subunit